MLAENFTWHEAKGDHFIIYHYTGNEDFAREVLTAADRYYKDIAYQLGYERYSEFWSWDKRVKIYIYPDHATFLKQKHQQEWSHGMADYNDKEITSYVRGTGFIETILPHEIAHLMFRDFVGFTGEVPLWLDEGVAQWAEETKRNHVTTAMRTAFTERKFLSFSDMMKLDIRNIKMNDQVNFRFNAFEGEPILLIMSGANLVSLYYLQAVSLVGFLIERYGKNNFTVFCRELRNGKMLDEALKAAYAVSLPNSDAFEKQWKSYIAGQ